MMTLSEARAAILAEQSRLEPERAACEARYCAKMRPHDWDDYRKGVAETRGKDAADKLMDAVRKEK